MKNADLPKSNFGATRIRQGYGVASKPMRRVAVREFRNKWPLAGIDCFEPATFATGLPLARRSQVPVR